MYSADICDFKYAFDDFTISQVAKELGHTLDWKTYVNRSRAFEFMWDPSVTIEGGDGIKGFMQVSVCAFHRFLFL